MELVQNGALLEIHEEEFNLSRIWLKLESTAVWKKLRLCGPGSAHTVALPAVKSRIPRWDPCKGLSEVCLTMPCLYFPGRCYLGTGMLHWSGSCLVWYTFCPDQEKFIFLAKQQWFCSYWCSCLDTRRFCTSFSKQNSTASLLLL